MAPVEDIHCPVSGCPETGSVSQIIHHVTKTPDGSHEWDTLGYDNSYEFRVAHEADSEQGDAGSQDSDAFSRNPALEAVPAIGDTRANALREAGFDSAAAVAEADVDDLAEVKAVSPPTAECIQVTAREACGYSETFISELAASIGVDRSAVADAYGTLAATVVTPTEAEETLRRRFGDDDDDSVLNLDGCPIRHLHYLHEAGFERVADVATTSIAELAEAQYVGETRAEAIQERARRVLSDDPTIGETCDAEPVATESSTPPDEPMSSSTTGDSPIVNGTFPPTMRERNQWLLWKETDDGRKVPRAPWETGDPLQYVSAMASQNWTSFELAVQWMEKLPQEMELAFALTRDDEFVFVDLDDVVVDGVLTDAAADLVETAGTYTAYSTSGTGLHLYGRGELSADVKSLMGPLTDDGDQSIEVYDRNRFVAMTGDHLERTPSTLTVVDDLLAELEGEFATVQSSTPDRATTEPRRSPEELQSIETTDDIQDVFDAIRQTTPADISLRSTQTKTHGDGTYSYDPSWVHSESGTRLGVTDEGWIYRKGMIALDALQVVALEEGIITDERAYPEGESYWEAVEALRDRGAHIPKYKPETSPPSGQVSTDPDFTIDEREVAKRLNYGQEVRTHVHRFDRDYQERLALRLAPILAEAAESLYLSPAVTYRAAEVYAAGHAAGVVEGAAHEATIAAALRIASIEADHPRPLDVIGEELGTDPTTIRTKLRRLLKETGITDAIDAADLVAEPSDYISYLARQLEVHDDDTVVSEVEALLDAVETQGGTSPMSEVGAAFYVVLKQAADYSHTQQSIADAAGISAVTIRKNYQKYADQQ